MEVMHCVKPGCGTSSLINQYCVKCGSQMVKGGLKPAINYPCPRCGASCSDSDKFCGTCGNKITAKKGK
jgi:hypothetical protein